MMNPQALKERLKHTAKNLGIGYNEAFHYLVMERFLVRLSMSSCKDKFVFKGGFLLAKYLELERDTRDLDFLLQKINGEKETVQRSLTELAAMNPGDGFLFQLKEVSNLPHEHMKYPGFRANFNVTLGKIRERLEIDVGFGDIVEPQNLKIPLMTAKDKSIYEGEISLLVYPIETILAEKLHAIIYRQENNSRMKDYFDVFCIFRAGIVDESRACAAIQSTFLNRGASLTELPVAFSEKQISILQKRWTVFYGDHKNVEGLPAQIGELIAFINEYLAEFRAVLNVDGE